MVDNIDVKEIFARKSLINLMIKILTLRFKDICLMRVINYNNNVG